MAQCRSKWLNVIKPIPSSRLAISNSISLALMPSSLKLKTSTPILKQEQTKLFTLWQSLQDHNDSLFFRTPVDKNAFPDYHLYVKHPMDLSTIQRCLRDGKYTSVEEVLDDIQMIWDNCRRYNPAGTWIYNISISMERNFKKMARYFLPHVPIDPLPAKSQEKPPGIIDEDDIFPWEEVSFQEKYTFVLRMQLLPPHSLKALIESIVELAPKAFVEEDDKARLVVDYIDAVTFPIVKEKLEELMVAHRISNKRLKSA